MKLSLSALKSISADKISVPDREIFELPEKVLQFGTGVLLRGLPDFFIDAANKMGIFNGRIVVVKSTAKGDTKAFDSQDGLYTLCERGIQNGKKVERNILCSAISRVLTAPTEWKEILKCAHNEKMQIIISNTTEVGIQLVNEDIHQQPPVSYPGKLLAFLYERFKAFKGSPDAGFIIIPTELLPENGAMLKSIALELAHLNHLEDSFIEWLKNSNTFCNSLVDRIVIGMPPQELRNKIESELGYTDDLLTVSEVYRLWAIEGDEKIKSILSFAAADEGIKIEPSIDLYRELKLRLLNATHTLCCGLAFYSDFDVVYQAMNDEAFSSFLERLMREEIAPAVPYEIEDAVKQNYISHVIDRFSNPHIQHRWINITLNYTSKMKTRCIPLLVEHYGKSNMVPHLFALGFAAYLWFMKPVTQKGKEFFGKKGNQEYLIEDPLAEKLSAHWQKDNIESVVNGVLSDISLWEYDLTQFDDFCNAVTNNLHSIKNEGMKNTLNIIQKKGNVIMKQKVMMIHPKDNVLVALTNLEVNEQVQYNGNEYTLMNRVPAKHKFVIKDLSPGDEIYMYGVLVGKAETAIPKGSRITTSNVKHAASSFAVGERKTEWNIPDISKFKDRTFKGFYRADGKVGTANYWLVIPLVFCENRNVEILKEALVNELGYGKNLNKKLEVSRLIDLYKEGKNTDEILNADVQTNMEEEKKQRIFPNVDGVKFLSHEGGCGGTRDDAQALCGLLAGYITHSNVAGATVLSLGCQNAQVGILQEEIKKRDSNFSKPLYILEQQQIGRGSDMISKAIRQTFAGLIEANKIERKPAPLSKLTIGLECGGSDGFSGISANPAIGYTSDLLVALGGTVILSEFPELCGVEQNLSDRCVDKETAIRFGTLMRTYNDRAKAVGSGFDMNPSPGNIKDGLITDAIKSAGAAKKGGTSPVTDVLDYPEMVTKPGLNLLCTPGNDVESTTAEVGSGANIVLFTTGLGTPTGNPVAPVIKLSSNTILFNKMNDIIDINTGTIIEGEETVEQAGERILDYVIKVASGEIEVSSVRHKQNDFIPWKRGVSL